MMEDLDGLDLGSLVIVFFKLVNFLFTVQVCLPAEEVSFFLMKAKLSWRSVRPKSKREIDFHVNP